MKIRSVCLALVTGAVLSAPGYAATATGTLNLSITISATCTVVSASAINFGTMSSIPASVDQTSTLTVNCSNTTPYVISLGVGGGAGATTAVRKMTNAGNTVNYSLYRDAGYTQLWGASSGVDTLAGTGNAANQALTIYGRVPTQTVPPPGTYTDAVTVTITY